MIRVLVACAFTAALTILLTAALIVQGGTRTLAALAGTEPFVPACAQATYGADGNMGPLFCVVDNPAALKTFAPMAQHTFALGPKATPTQVTAALVADYKRVGTIPILCSIYRLAVWRNHWRFGIPASEQVGAKLGFSSGWCSEPSFSDVR
jgi:hypothetical protein